MLIWSLDGGRQLSTAVLKLLQEGTRGPGDGSKFLLPCMQNGVDDDLKAFIKITQLRWAAQEAHIRLHLVWHWGKGMDRML